MRPSNASAFVELSMYEPLTCREAAFCVPVADAVITTEFIVVIAPSVSLPADPQNQAYPRAPVTGKTLALIELVVPAVATVAFALGMATPPPKMSFEPSALMRVICPWIPPAMLPFISPSRVKAAQMTDQV